MRDVERISITEEIKREEGLDVRLETYLAVEITDAFSARSEADALYKELLRMYKGTPAEEFSKDILPIKNIEITLGATAVDTLYAQTFDMTMNASPITTVRATPQYVDEADAIQTLLNYWVVDPFANFRYMADDYILDTIKLGTGIIYTIWIENRRKTGTEKIIDRGPRFYAIDTDNFIVPGASKPDVETLHLVGYRDFMTRGELDCRGQANGWDVALAEPTNNMSGLHRRRSDIVETREENKALIDYFEIMHLFVSYDYDMDGYDEQLLVVWDQTAKKVLKLSYNPFDRLPFSVARFQPQEHMFYGMGAMEMIAPYQKEATDWHNFRMANARLANSRVYTVKYSSPLVGQTLRLVPNKPLYVGDAKDVQALAMADIYPSALAYESATMQMADRRVGTMTDFQSKPMPGHRTPSQTISAVLQAINRRFVPAFDSMKQGMSDALRQALLRTQEQYRSSGEARAFIDKQLDSLLGPKEAAAAKRVMAWSAQDVYDNLKVEMTASSQYINREMDKQNAMQLIGILGGYYEKAIQMATISGNPQVPPEIKKLLHEVAKKSNEAMDQLLRTFDQTRLDPGRFILSEDDFAGLEAQLNGQLGGGVTRGQGEYDGLPHGPAGNPNESVPDAGVGGGFGDAAVAGSDTGNQAGAGAVGR